MVSGALIGDVGTRISVSILHVAEQPSPERALPSSGPRPRIAGRRRKTALADAIGADGLLLALVTAVERVVAVLHTSLRGRWCRLRILTTVHAKVFRVAVVASRDLAGPFRSRWAGRPRELALFRPDEDPSPHLAAAQGGPASARNRAPERARRGANRRLSCLPSSRLRL